MKILTPLQLFILILIPVSFISFKQHNNPVNPYGLEIISDIQSYKKSVVENPDNELIDLETYIPGLILDIRYATSNNFTGKIIYDSPKAFVRKPVADALKQIQAGLKSKNLGIKIFDAYRPYSTTVKFYEIYPDTNFVAAPWHGSRHNRGCAVDVSLIDLKTGLEIPMPTTFDDFTAKAASDYSSLPDNIIRNRKVLADVMTSHGFFIYPTEWWHYDFMGWEQFKLMGIPFEILEY
jgi:D-alanyl-D-alanine dipeptidase